MRRVNSLERALADIGKARPVRDPLLTQAFRLASSSPNVPSHLFLPRMNS
jgi:hypothetical protein